MQIYTLPPLAPKLVQRVLGQMTAEEVAAEAKNLKATLQVFEVSPCRAPCTCLA